MRTTRVTALARLELALRFALALLNATTEGAGVSEDVGPALGRPLKRAKAALPPSLTALTVMRCCCASSGLRGPRC